MHLARGTPVRGRFQPSPVTRDTGGFACPRFPEAARLHSRRPSPSRRQACSRPDSTEPPIQPAPSLTHVMLRNSPPLYAIGKATPAGFRPSVILPHLRDGRYPASPVLQASPPPSAPRGVPVAACTAPYAFHLPCIRRHYPGGNRPVLTALLPAGRRPSPILRRVGFRVSRFEACSAFTHVPACMVAKPPKAAILPECFNPCRYLHEPLWPLPAGATVAGWDSHPRKARLSTAH